MELATRNAQKNSSEAPSGTTDLHRVAAARVVQAMRERLSEQLSLDEMAEIALMSPYHFNRVFRRTTGIPPSQFLSALRLEAAKRLLLTTERSVTDICFEVGYNSLGTFTTRFTQLVGLSPSQLRILSRVFTPASASELLHMLDGAPQPESGPWVEGALSACPEEVGLIFIGLFPKAIPQDRPLACAILPRSGSFQIRAPEEGRFFLFAAGLAKLEKPLDYLMCGGSIRGVASAGPLLSKNNQVSGSADLTLRAPDILDPPLLVTLPLLIDERLSAQIEQLERMQGSA